MWKNRDGGLRVVVVGMGWGNSKVSVGMIGFKRGNVIGRIRKKK